MNFPVPKLTGGKNWNRKNVAHFYACLVFPCQSYGVVSNKDRTMYDKGGETDIGHLGYLGTGYPSRVRAPQGVIHGREEN